MADKADSQPTSPIGTPPQQAPPLEPPRHSSPPGVAEPEPPNTIQATKFAQRNFRIPRFQGGGQWSSLFSSNGGIRFVRHQDSLARVHHAEDEPTVEMEELLSWNLPSSQMTTEYINDYVDRTGSDSIQLGRARLGIAIGDTILRPILCAREQPQDRDAVYNRGPRTPAGRHLGPTYLVLGMFRRHTTVPYEISIPIWPERDLCEAIRSGTNLLRGPGALFSLKYVSGFSIYRCHTADGFHSQVIIDDRTKNTLVQLYADIYGYGKAREDARINEAWKPWIHKHLNSDTYDAKEGVYSLQLEMSWSAYRIMAIATTPVALSLAIGIWYMVKFDKPEEAFVIATYIATSGGVLLAIITAVVALS
ncbi:hypothetical protein BP6252_11265 [Coleophoma cylindrospora]|uniref:Uncharacterized protein n=1 Tax=Coleophoma cylindrospora TaxID=1849047 RepID=A0A3D8QQ01_9HELO|nr:hypothetical protein BP6252_11265 [Coleophoma cylindrospora]